MKKYFFNLTLFAFILFSFLLKANPLLNDSEELKTVSNNFSETKGIVRTLANVVWPISIGWILALSHLIAGLLNILGGVLFCWTIVGFAAGIVNARVHFRLIPASFAPFGRIIISSDVAKRLNEISTEKAVDEIIG